MRVLRKSEDYCIMGHRRKPAKAALLLGALLLLATTTTASANKCTVGCHGQQAGKSYQEGRTYIYDLEGSSVTSVTEAQGEAKLKLKAEVELTAKANCVRQLRLKNVRVNGAPVSQADIEKHALQFNYHDGHIDSEVCAEAGDSQASLNVKRAVVSLFQSAVFQDSGSSSRTEVDVLGGCPTDFRFSKDGDTVTVKKWRNLEQCSYRENVGQGLVSSVLDASAGLKSTPLLASRQKVEQVFKRGVLHKAVSVETYKFQPFRNGDAGAATTVETVLTLKAEADDKPEAPVSEAKSLVFEAPHPLASSSAEAIEDALNAAKDEEREGAKAQAAEKFSELVRVLRASRRKDILSVYRKVQAGAGFDQSSDKKLFLDALFRAGTGESAEVGAELLKNGEIAGPQALTYYASLALVNHVNLPSVSAIVRLLDEPNLPRVGYLGVGQVIGKYCQAHSCENLAEVKSAVHKVREKVGNGKAKTREQEDVIVTALKALGNARFLDDATMQRIANIAADKSVRSRVRVAAVESLPARCSMKWKNVLFRVLEDLEEDSEVRVKSYLSLVRCVCPQVANKVKEVLDKEKVNQVGSFIASHLRSVRASADPNKQEAKRQLGLIRPRTHFPEDFRKFSFHEEFSYSVDAFGVGSTAESNVIYSQDSFVPRSASLNLTSQLFGHSVNWLEVNGRLENVDRLIERYLGPKGEITKAGLRLGEAAEEGAGRARDVAGYIKGKFDKLTRRRREVKQGELDRFAKGVRLRAAEVDETPGLDLSVKLFGVELAYFSQQLDTAKLSVKGLIDKVFESLETALTELKSFDYSVQHHAQFVDAELLYPTGLGVPLRLGVVGTGVVHLKTAGNLDVAALAKEPGNAAVRIALEPSASIRVVGSLAVDGFGAQSGLKVISSLYTSTGTDVTVKLLEGSGIDVNVAVPAKKQELVTVSSEVLLSSSGAKGAEKFAVAPKFDSKGREHSDCFEQFSPFLGLTLCGHISYPYGDLRSVQKRPFGPLSGPSKFSLTVDSNDVSSFHFRAYYDAKSPKARSFELLFDTPNSRRSRHMSFVAKAGLEPDMFAKAAFVSPIKELSAEAVVKSEPQEHTLTLTLRNDQIEYFARAGLLADGKRYKPVLEYKVPEHIEQLAGRKNSGNPEKAGAAGAAGAAQTYRVDGTVELSDADGGGQKYVFEKVYLNAGSRKIVGIDGTVLVSPGNVAVDANVGYGEETLALTVDGKRIAEKNYALVVSAVPSRDPSVGFNLKWEYQRGPTELSNKLTFTHGADLRSATNRFTLEQRALYKLEPKDFRLSGSNKIEYPAVGLDFDLEADVSKKSLSAEVDLKYAKFKCGAEFSAKVSSNAPGDYEVELELEFLNNALEVKSKRVVVEPHTSRFVNSLKLSPGGQYQSDVTATYDVKANEARILLTGDLDLNGKKVNVDTGLEANPQRVSAKAVLQVAATKHLDFSLAVEKGAKANGNLKLNLSNYLTAQGAFGYQNGKGNGQFDLDIPRIERRIKATGSVAHSDSQCKADFQLLYDADKDPQKRIQLSTVTDLAGNTVDSKNVLDIVAYKTAVNVKLSREGEFNNGQQKVNVEVTLPDGRYVLYKLDRSVTTKARDQFEGYANWELTDHVSKGGASRKVKARSTVHKFDSKNEQYDVNGELEFVNFGGESVKTSAGFKHAAKDGERKESMFAADVFGSMLPKTFKLAVSADYDKKNVNWKGKSFLGEGFVLEGNGGWSCGGGGKPSKFDASVKAKLPSERLRNIQLDVSESLSLPNELDGSVEYIGSQKITYNDDKTIKIDDYAKHTGVFDDEHKSDGEFRLTVAVLNNPAVTIGASYARDPTGAQKKLAGNVNVKYGDEEANFAADTTFSPDLSSVQLNLRGTSSVEKFRNVEVRMSHEREKEGLVRKTDFTLTTDAGKYRMTSDVRVSNVSPSIDIVLTCPSGKTELLARFHKSAERDYTGEWKLDTPQGFVAADARVNLESVDDFVVTVNFDSDKIQQRKIHAEIANKPTAKTGRRVMIVITSGGKNIVTGSTNYKRRDEEGKTVVEGNGNLKIGESTRSSSFKYTRQQLSREVDGEIGVAMVLNANFGPSAIVGELKLSNKEILVFNSYCEQSKDCAHFKLQAALDTDQKTYAKHQTTVEVDLKKFNVPVEFGVKTSAELKDFRLDHTASLYMHSSKGKSEYKHQFYLHPTEAASILTLPSREMALLASVELPKSRQAGVYRLDVSHYFDRKNKPAEKTSLLLTGDVNIEKSSASVNGEARFTYPSQAKDMTVKGKVRYGGEEHWLDASLDLDVFAKKAQKISIAANVIRAPLDRGYNLTANVGVNSRGQQLKLENENHLVVSASQLGFGSFLSYTDVQQKAKTVGALFSATPRQISLLVVSPKRELIRSDTKITFTKNLQKIDNELAVLGNEPVVTNVEAQDLSNFKFLHYSKSNPGTKLTANSVLVVGQLFEAHADAYKDGAKKNLFNVLVHLNEEKFLKPDFNYDKDNIVGVIEYQKEKAAEMGKLLKEVLHEIAKEAITEIKDLVDHLKRSQPNIKPLLEYYESERSKVRNELDADETIKEIRAALNKLFGGISNIIIGSAKQLSERLNDLYTQFFEILSKIAEAMKSTYPQLADSLSNIVAAFARVIDAFANLGMAYLKALLNVVSQHQKDIRDVAVAAAEMVQDVGKVIFKAASQLSKDLREFAVLLYQQLQALPIFEVIVQQYGDIREYGIPESIVSIVEEFCNTLKALMPTPELQEFSNVSCSYIVKFLRHQKVDKENELKSIAAHGVAALQSILGGLQSYVTPDNLLSLLDLDVSFDPRWYLEKLPGIASLKVSVIDLIRNRELPTVAELYYTYRPTLYATDIVPPFSKTGIIADGGHIFTFDGRHLTLPGSCHYILAQDFEDGNFSVIAHLNNGEFQSITLTEPKESVTLKSDGRVLVNGKAADYPASTKNLHAYYVKPTANVKSRYGVHITCSEEAPLICTVRVSGFYIGKLRGLFGDGNNEPYDDYTLPAGTITENPTEFANAYKLKPDCPAATAAARDTKRAPLCTDYFSGSSPLSACFNYVNPSNFREACDHAVSAATPHGACLMAVAYYAACRQARISLSIPPACGNCQVGGNSIHVGDSFSVKIPTKEADIVFVVEQDADNEKVYRELITPVMTELRNELKQHGIADVHIGLVGFGEKMEYPEHYTLNGHANIEGEVRTMKFPPKDHPLLTLEDAKQGNLEKKMQYIAQRLDVELGTIKLTDGYQEAIRYPFRPGAAKAVVGVLSSPCEKSPFPLSLQQLRVLLGRKIYNDLGITYYHVYMPGEVSVSGKPQKNIVGFDQSSAYTFADSKKKPMAGNSELKNNLELPAKDVCADFAADNGGASFVSNNFLEGKANQKKQFVQVMTRRIADGLTATEFEEDCVCTQVRGLYGRTNCKIVDRKDKRVVKRDVKA